MNPGVKTVKPNPDYTITLVFTNGEVRRFDVKPYLGRGFFQELRDMSVFIIRSSRSWAVCSGRMDRISVPILSTKIAYPKPNRQKQWVQKNSSRDN